MNANTRACVAYIAGGIYGAVGSSVYDYTQSKYISISGSVKSNRVNIYDYDRRCYISGSLSNLYDYGNSAHIQLTMNGFQFNGYDYGSSCHFSGTINGNSISIYDYETSNHHSYSV